MPHVQHRLARLDLGHQLSGLHGRTVGHAPVRHDRGLAVDVGRGNHDRLHAAASLTAVFDLSLAHQRLGLPVGCARDDGPCAREHGGSSAQAPEQPGAQLGRQLGAPRPAAGGLLDGQQTAGDADRTLHGGPVDRRQLRRDEQFGEELLLDRQPLEHASGQLRLIPVRHHGQRAILVRHHPQRDGRREAVGAVAADRREAWFRRRWRGAADTAACARCARQAGRPPGSRRTARPGHARATLRRRAGAGCRGSASRGSGCAWGRSRVLRPTGSG